MAGQAQKPSWDKLFGVASGQDGLFTIEQADMAGFSRQLLYSYMQSGRVKRARRGIYRIVHYPQGDHEELAELWLWSKQAGVFSHGTALSLHGLSDILPRRVHLSVPSDWRLRRLKVPAGLVLHHSTVPPAERIWVGPVPVTEPGRTLLDCSLAHLSPDLLAQAFYQARARGLVSAERLQEVARAAGLAEVPG